MTLVKIEETRSWKSVFVFPSWSLDRQQERNRKSETAKQGERRRDREIETERETDRERERETHVYRETESSGTKGRQLRCCVRRREPPPAMVVVEGGGCGGYGNRTWW